MRIIASTKDRPATIELSDRDRATIAQMDSEDFLRETNFPEDISVMEWKRETKEETDE